jgi:hypothetical protein
MRRMKLFAGYIVLSGLMQNVGFAADGVQYSKIYLEEASSESIQVKMVGVDSKGKTSVISPDVNEILPKGDTDLVLIPAIFSFVPKTQCVYLLLKHVDSDDIKGTYEYDIKLKKVRQIKIDLNNEFDTMWTVIQISPDGAKVASSGNNIQVFDLAKGKKILMITPKDAGGILLGRDSIVEPEEKTPENLFRWSSSTTLTYPIYSRGEKETPNYFKELKTVKVP